MPCHNDKEWNSHRRIDFFCNLHELNILLFFWAIIIVCHDVRNPECGYTIHFIGWHGGKAVRSSNYRKSQDEIANKSHITYIYYFRICQIALSQFSQCEFLSLKYSHIPKAIYFSIYRYFIHLLHRLLSHHVWFCCQFFLVHYCFTVCIELYSYSSWN
jgi:hypothetical protein